jgi:hypothetical protein
VWGATGGSYFVSVGIHPEPRLNGVYK